MMKSAVWAASLITAQTPLKDRQRILAPFFDPPPGEMATVTARALSLTRTADTLLTKGEIWVKPPPGQCLILRTDLTKRDHKFCSAKPWTWEPFDLDPAGRLNVTIVTGSQDEGTPLTWPTPYRIANYVPIIADDPDDNINIPVLSCKTSIDQDQRKITLELMDGRRWFIYLPDVDQAVEGATPPPNLIVRIDSKKDASGKPISDAKAAQNRVDAEGPGTEEPKKRRSILSQLLSGDYKSIKKNESAFHIGKRNAYEMSSSHFMETSVPQGMTDVCRYMYDGAPGDPGSGVIECYNTDSFAAVYTHVTCFSDFSPRKAPSAAEKR